MEKQGRVNAGRADCVDEGQGQNLPGPAAVIPAVLRSRAKYKALHLVLRTSGPDGDRY